MDHQPVVLRAHDVLDGGDQVSQGDGVARWPRGPWPGPVLWSPRYGPYVAMPCPPVVPLPLADEVAH